MMPRVAVQHLKQQLVYSNLVLRILRFVRHEQWQQQAVSAIDIKATKMWVMGQSSKQLELHVMHMFLTALMVKRTAVLRALLG